ncbi:DUF366 family protein [bacterium]|nr:DUF366 family protein [bacterium]
MNIHFIEKETAYNGSQLRSHFILNNTGLYGDGIVAFIGPCDVKLDHMVDLEDVIAKKSIYSESMLHFIVEHFDMDLERMVLRQRLLISLIQTELLDQLDQKIVRRGDDLYLDEYKLTVSIATTTPVSCVIHTGININSNNTPVLTQGLNDFGINPQAFARAVMNRYAEEIAGVTKACTKVRGVQ